MTSEFSPDSKYRKSELMNLQVQRARDKAVDGLVPALVTL